MRWLCLILLFFSFTQPSWAAELRWQPASMGLAHLDTALAQAKDKIHFPEAFGNNKRKDASFVAFPKSIPYGRNKAYAHFIVLEDRKTYAIEAATEPACDLRKTCLLGSLTLEWGANPTIYYDRENLERTTPVRLHRGQQGYYTRGFAMADFWPARLSWRYHEVLYTLTWQGEDDRTALVTMANSILDQLAQSA